MGTRVGGALVIGLVVQCVAAGVGAQPATRSADAYTTAGFPDWNKRWASQELGQAATALAKLAKSDLSRLPVRGKGESGALFARMTSAENLQASCDDQTLSIAARTEACIDACDATNAILKIYVHPKGQPGEPSTLVEVERHARKRVDEIVELTGAALRCIAAQSRTADAFARSLDPKMVGYQKRMSGLGAMREGAEIAVHGVLVMLKEPAWYRGDEPERLVAFLGETLPEIFRFLLPKSRTTLADMIEAMSNDPSKGRIRPLLARLHQRLELGTAGEPFQPEAPARSAGVDPGAITIHRARAGELGKGGWTRAVATTGRFSIEVPDAFEDYTVNENRAQGTLVPIHVLRTKTSTGALFLAVMLDAAKASGPVPPLKPMDNLAPSIPNAKTQQRVVAMGKLRANELTAIGPTQGMTARWLIADGNLYQLLVEYPILLRGVIDPDIKRFFDSFRLPDPRAAGR